MTPQEFCYWLQGLFEVGDVKQLDERQTAIVRDHLQEVFTKVTPVRPVVVPERDIRYPGGHPPEPPAAAPAPEVEDLLASIRRVRAQGPLPARLCGSGERYC